MLLRLWKNAYTSKEGYSQTIVPLNTVYLLNNLLLALLAIHLRLSWRLLARINSLASAVVLLHLADDSLL